MIIEHVIILNLKDPTRTTRDLLRRLKHFPTVTVPLQIHAVIRKRVFEPARLFPRFPNVLCWPPLTFGRTQSGQWSSFKASSTAHPVRIQTFGHVCYLAFSKVSRLSVFAIPFKWCASALQGSSWKLGGTEVPYSRGQPKSSNGVGLDWVDI